MSLAIAGHACDNPLTSDNKVEGRKCKVKNSCKLFREMHLTYHCTHMEEDSKLLKVDVISQKQPPIASQETSSNQPLVDEVVDPIQYSIDPTSPLKGEFDTTQVFLVNSDCPRQGEILNVSIKSPPSTEVIPFDWDNLAELCLPSSIPF